MTVADWPIVETNQGQTGGIVTMIAIGRQSPLADQSETDYSGFGPINGGHPKRKIELVQEFAAKRTKSVAIALPNCS